MALMGGEALGVSSWAADWGPPGGERELLGPLVARRGFSLRLIWEELTVEGGAPVLQSPKGFPAG